jgi:hypothetical protein
VPDDQSIERIARCIATDDKFLRAIDFIFQPSSTAPSWLINRIFALGDDALSLVLIPLPHESDLQVWRQNSETGVQDIRLSPVPRLKAHAESPAANDECYGLDKPVCRSIELDVGLGTKML